MWQTTLIHLKDMRCHDRRRRFAENLQTRMSREIMLTGSRPGPWCEVPITPFGACGPYRRSRNVKPSCKLACCQLKLAEVWGKEV